MQWDYFPFPKIKRGQLHMIASSTSKTQLKRNWRTLDNAVIGIVIVETLLVTMALVPAQLWTRLLPHATDAALNGPFPAAIAPLITALIYLLPTFIGLLSRSWQRALLYATLPAWLGLGAFVIAATFKVGVFYLVSSDHVTANVSVLELFAALGGIGWLLRYLLKIR
jgi:hypothetical protein